MFILTIVIKMKSYLLFDIILVYCCAISTTKHVPEDNHSKAVALYISNILWFPMFDCKFLLHC